MHALRVVDDQVLVGAADNKLYCCDRNLATTGTHDLPDCVRAVDKKGNDIIVGCINGDIVQISGAAKKTVMESHSDGEVWGLAVNPSNPNQVVTSGDDNKIKVWDCS